MTPIGEISGEVKEQTRRDQRRATRGPQTNKGICTHTHVCTYVKPAKVTGTYLGQPGATCERYRALIKFTGAYARVLLGRVLPAHERPASPLASLFLFGPFSLRLVSHSVPEFFKARFTCRRNVGRGASAVLFARALPTDFFSLLPPPRSSFVLPFLRLPLCLSSLVFFVPFVSLRVQLAFISFCLSGCTLSSLSETTLFLSLISLVFPRIFRHSLSTSRVS